MQKSSLALHFLPIYVEILLHVLDFQACYVEVEVGGWILEREVWVRFPASPHHV